MSMSLFALILASVAALVSGQNTVEFVNQDSTRRTIYFTQQEGLASINPATINGLTIQTVTFPQGWSGNWYSVSSGADNIPGVLGEVTWNGWDGLTYFDVSAIVNSHDLDGVKILAPKTSGTPYSGCESYVDRCGNAYYAPDDVQTKNTSENTLICTLGNPVSVLEPNGTQHARHLITGRSPSIAHIVTSNMALSKHGFSVDNKITGTLLIIVSIMILLFIVM